MLKKKKKKYNPGQVIAFVINETKHINKYRIFSKWLVNVVIHGIIGCLWCHFMCNTDDGIDDWSKCLFWSLFGIYALKHN